MLMFTQAESGYPLIPLPASVRQLSCFFLTCNFPDITYNQLCCIPCLSTCAVPVKLQMISYREDYR